MRLMCFAPVIPPMCRPDNDGIELEVTLGMFMLWLVRADHVPGTASGQCSVVQRTQLYCLQRPCPIFEGVVLEGIVLVFKSTPPAGALPWVPASFHKISIWFLPTLSLIERSRLQLLLCTFAVEHGVRQ